MCRSRHLDRDRSRWASPSPGPREHRVQRRRGFLEPPFGEQDKRPEFVERGIIGHQAKGLISQIEGGGVIPGLEDLAHLVMRSRPGQ